MSYNSLEEIVVLCQREQLKFWEVILNHDINERSSTKDESMSLMKKMWETMLQSAADYDGTLKSASGLAGGAGALMEEYKKTGNTLCGNFISTVIARALQMGESNACMKRIVAAPTAGACGVMPSILVPYFQEKKADTESILEAMYVSAGIGQVIASRAFISGAAGGCQAEIGSASAMTAGALVHLQGGNALQITHAAAIALKSLLGLVCDPVAGLVEVPCVKRNVIGAVNALSSAEMALAGIRSAIPPDQVIDAMREVGEKMDISLRETGKGGLAATEIGIEMAEKLNK